MDDAQPLQHDGNDWVILCFWVIYNQADLHMIPSLPTVVLLLENEQKCLLTPKLVKPSQRTGGYRRVEYIIIKLQRVLIWVVLQKIREESDGLVRRCCSDT